MKRKLRFVISLLMVLSILLGCTGGLTMPVRATDNNGTVTFVYTGTDETKTAVNLWFYVNWAKSVTLKPEGGAGQLGDFGIGWSQSTYAGKPCVILSGDTTDLSEVWITLGFSAQIGSSLEVKFDGAVYSVSDTAVTMGYSDPAHTHTPANTWSSNETHHYHSCTDTSCTETDVSKLPDYAAHAYDNDEDTACNTCGYTREVSVSKNYSFTIHVYTNGLTGTWLKSYLGEWQEEAYPALGGETDGWSTAAYTLNTTVEYNKYTFYFYKTASDYTEYVYSFTGTTNELWIIPGDGTVYTSKPATGGATPPEHTHIWSGWKTDASCHWKECEAEGCTTPVATSESGEHSYDDAQDTQCNTCGYSREASSAKNYSFTIHAYTKGLSGYWLRTCLGDWKEDTYPTFGAEVEGWSDAVYKITSAENYEQLIICFYKSAADYTIWTQPITSTSGEYWAIPGVDTIYTSKEAAEAALQDPDPDVPPVEKKDYSFTVHFYGSGWLTAWMSKVENGTETAWTASADNRWPTLAEEADGWYKADIAWEAQADGFNRLNLLLNGAAEPAYNYDFTGYSGEVWFIPGSTTAYTSKADAEKALPEEAPKPVEKTDFNFTVHVYGSGWMTAWMAKVENGTETGWTAEADNQWPTLESEGNGWGKATITWVQQQGDLNRLCLMLNGDTAVTYNCDFIGNSGEFWIIPGESVPYTSQAAAEEQLGEGVTDTTLIVHVKKAGNMSGWQVGSWFTEEIDGTWGNLDTPFTYQDDWGYVAVIHYDMVVSSLEIQLHQACIVDGWKNEWYAWDDFTKVKVNITRGFGEVWLEYGVQGYQSAPPEGHGAFDAATAETYNSIPYAYYNTPGSINAYLNIHYFRHDGEYTDWQLGLWGQQKDGTWAQGNLKFNGTDEYGAVTGKFYLGGWTVSEVGMVPHYRNWSHQDGKNLSWDIGDLKAGETIDLFIYSGYDGVYTEPQEDKLVPPALVVIPAKNTVQSLGDVTPIVPALGAEAPEQVLVQAEEPSILWLVIAAFAAVVGIGAAAGLMLIRKKGE